MRLLLSIIFISLSFASVAQQQLPPEVSSELKRRGVAEQDVRDRLTERGIDPDGLTREQLIVLQPEIENIVEELEAEAAAEEARGPADGSPSPQKATGNLASPASANVPAAGTATGSGRSNEEAASEQAVLQATAARTKTAADTLPEIYGHRIFDSGALSVFRASDQAEAPDNYTLGMGDELAVNIFGQSQIDFLFRIDRQGFINPPGLAKILVRGLTLAQARELVQRRLSQYYLFSEGQFALTVNGARTIRVNVFGEVKQSGTYTLSAINGALNALVAAGGPSRIGSVRRIRRDRGSERTQIDVYEYLTDPSALADVLSLESSDIIFVPVAQELVTLRGAVRRPMIYELLPGEGVTELLEFAGGLRSGAYASLVQVRRLVAGQASVIDLDLAGLTSGRGFELQDGDIVDVRSLQQPERNSVSVEGSVELAGDFAFNKGATAADIIRQSRLRKNARTDVAFVQRTNSDSTSQLIEIQLDRALAGDENANVLLQPGDVIRVLSQNTYADRATVAITGAVRTPITRYPYSADSSLTVEAALLLAGGLSQNAAEEAILFRRDPRNTKITRYQLVDIRTGAAEVRMNPFDSLVVFPRELFTDAFVIDVRGAVRRPGSYRYDPSLGLKEVLTLAGGFTLDAATDRIEVFRLEFGNQSTTETRVGTIEVNANYEISGGDLSLGDLQPYDVIAVRSVPEFEVTTLASVEGEVKFPGSYALTDDMRRVGDLMKAAGGTTAEAFAAGATLYREDRNVGFVVLELDDVLSNPRSPNNVVLLPGDLLQIPKARELVAIRIEATKAAESYADSLVAGGSVSIAYQGAENAKWYINEYAGGFRERADRRTVTVQDPSGRIRRTKRLWFIKNYPQVTAGSVIAMQMKAPKKEKLPREPVDWTGIATAVMAGLTATLTTILIVDRLSQDDDPK